MACLYSERALQRTSLERHTYDSGDKRNKCSPSLIPIMNESLRERASEDHSASWTNIPRKRQLCVLALCDFMRVASFQTVCYYHLKSFNLSLSEDILSWQTGVVSSSFSGAQIFTALIWGWVTDSEWYGRKKVLIIGLFGTVMCCIGLAFSTSFLIAVFFRLLAGALNGTVRTMHVLLLSLWIC